MVKIHITEKDRYTLIQQSITLIDQAADCSIRVYRFSLSRAYFEEQRCSLATYYVPIIANLLAKHKK